MAKVRAPEREAEEPLAMTWSIGRVVAVVAVLAMVAFWAWIFSGAPARDNPDRLQDEAYVAQLEARCQLLRDDIDALPNAVSIDDVALRVSVLEEANALVDAFIDDVAAEAPTTGDAETTVSGWLDDWRTYLANRQDYAERLRTDADARLLLDLSPLGDSVDKTIEVFADVNKIPDCSTPGDVG